MSYARTRSSRIDKIQHHKSHADQYDEALQTGSPWRIKLEKFAYRKKYGKKDWAYFWQRDYGNRSISFALTSTEKQDGADPDDFSPSLTPNIFRSLLEKYWLGSFNWGGKIDVKGLDRMMGNVSKVKGERWREEDERCSHKQFDEMKEKYGLRHAPITWDRNKTPEEHEKIMIAEAREREEWWRRNREGYRERREARVARRNVDTYRPRREKPRRLVGRRDDERDVQEEMEKRFAGGRNPRKGERRDRARVEKQRKEFTSARVLRSVSIASTGSQE